MTGSATSGVAEIPQIASAHVGDMLSPQLCHHSLWQAVMTEAELSMVIATLEKLGQDATGWATLYRDPATGTLWEVTYPRSEMHGGGPRQLSEISPFDAIARYPTVMQIKPTPK
jgi:hypothetical protein